MMKMKKMMVLNGLRKKILLVLINGFKRKLGGRVGLRFGGIGDAVENIEDEEIKESAKFAMNDMDIPIMDLVEEFEITFKKKT